MLTFLILIFLIPFTIIPANSEDYFSSLVGTDKYNKILKEGEVTSVFKKGENLTLIPGTADKANLLKEIERVNPVIGVEILLMYQAQNRQFDTSRELLAIYNRLHAISSLEGIEYYSHSRKRMRTFFHKAYAITGPGKKERICDPAADVIKAADTLFAFLEDSTFGAYSGQVRYAFHTNYFSMDITNVSQIYYLLVPVVSPGKLKIYLAVFPYQDKILFYGFTCVNTVDLFNLAADRIPSFYNRLKAMFSWFTAGILSAP